MSLPSTAIVTWSDAHTTREAIAWAGVPSSTDPGDHYASGTCAGQTVYVKVTIGAKPDTPKPSGPKSLTVSVPYSVSPGSWVTIAVLDIAEDHGKTVTLSLRLKGRGYFNMRIGDGPQATSGLVTNTWTRHDLRLTIPDSGSGELQVEAVNGSITTNSVSATIG